MFRNAHSEYVTESDLVAAAIDYDLDACFYEDFAVPLEQEDLQVLRWSEKIVDWVAVGYASKSRSC